MPEVPYGIVDVDDEVWVTFDEVDRIGRVDLSTGDVEFVEEALDEPVDILPVGDDLFVSLSQADQVAVVDRATKVVRQKTPVGFSPFKLAEGMGSVWVTNTGTAETTGTVSRLAPGSRDLRPLQDPIALLNAPIELAVGDDRVYVANFGSATVSVLAPAG
jgi:DNA-binding beta-propeller fold protein YncE